MISLDLEYTLAEAGAEVIGAANTVDRAIALVATPGLTAAIVDLRLQNESAQRVAERLQQSGIPFVFYSGQADAEAARMWPLVPLLTKPASTEAIVSALAVLQHGS
jgi:ActR/RegA family two-component response regulator